MSRVRIGKLDVFNPQQDAESNLPTSNEPPLFTAVKMLRRGYGKELERDARCEKVARKCFRTNRSSDIEDVYDSERFRQFLKKVLTAYDYHCLDE